ncbi:MAG: CHRD domain-containing protein, partial [Actinomycetota bacterium]|nr:CHRD domain-containing protein [Actinomycetota bacterium]
MQSNKSLAIVLALLLTVLAGGTALANSARSGPTVKGQGRPQGGPAPFSQELDEAQGHGRGSETIRLFGLQQLDEASLITVDGRVFGAEDEVPFQFPGTALLRAQLKGHNELDEAGNRGAGDPDGTGTAHVELTIDPPEVCATLSVRNIGLPATGAHIHEGTATQNGPVVISLPVPGEDGRAEGCVTQDVSSELLAEIAADPAGYYVNVHNATFPAGAVRGQLGQDPDAVIPSPGDRI